MRFEERAAGREPSGRFGPDLAEWNRTYALYDQVLNGAVDGPVLTEFLTRQISAVIGTTLTGPAPGPLNAPGGAGSLVRVMPMADPQFPSLFADVPAVRVPTGEMYKAGAGETVGLAVPPIVTGYSQYNCYEFDVPFSARPYAVLPNSRMVAIPVDFYDVDGSRKRLTAHPEWLRFVQTFVDDVDSRISASVGSAMVYRAKSFAGVVGGPDGAMFTGIPDMIVPDQRVMLRWFAVPMRYVTSPNSYLLRYKGFINQTPFLGRVKGSLLYLGAKTLRAFTPPRFAVPPQGDPLLAGSFYSEPLLDLELSFIFTARRRFAPEAAPGDFTLDPDSMNGNEMPNKNWIDGPHNWLPHFATKRYFYAHAKTAPNPNDYAKWVPYYLSVPHEILFQDPDVPGVVIGL